MNEPNVTVTTATPHAWIEMTNERDRLKAEVEKSNKAAAEMRDLLVYIDERILSPFIIQGDCQCEPCNAPCVACACEHATKSFLEIRSSADCGRDYVHRSEVERLREALSKLHDDCMACDFNEHWDSYKNAKSALEKEAR